MNKSEIELANVNSVIADMPEHERVLCLRMIDSLMMSVGHPITGNTFMMAIAQVNCRIAVNAIRLGVVDENGGFIQPGKEYVMPKVDKKATLHAIEGIKQLSKKTEIPRARGVTRISTDPSDPGYHPKIDLSKVEVYLNNEQLNRCITADIDLGKAWVMKRDENGNVEADASGNVVIEELEGKVEIVIKS